ncbi:hypothetical protein N658DRAFT_317217 [Parathielavia hyrcaniae]|uniref:Uncharacterized protein n=1 Tax=Parathielavia hyrcaniae TaxID=113614 RepID=A0AAN6PS67_9PEZI|nr:hypothetical protein N658DRAFT_317217 [Parathielavia hyrcaniae]
MANSPMRGALRSYGWQSSQLSQPDNAHCQIMKAVPSPISASKTAASRARVRPQLATVTANVHRRQIANLRGVDSLRTPHLAVAQGHHRAAQHTRRISSSRPALHPCNGQGNKANHQAKVGMWLAHVDACRVPPQPCPSPEMDDTSSNTVSPETTQIMSTLSSPRIPLADITPLVLAAKSSPESRFWSLDQGQVDLPSPPQSRRHAPDLTSAIGLLTEDETRRLLLLSAQSNASLATAIREIALV